MDRTTDVRISLSTGAAAPLRNHIAGLSYVIGEVVEPKKVSFFADQTTWLIQNQFFLFGVKTH